MPTWHTVFLKYFPGLQYLDSWR